MLIISQSVLKSSLAYTSQSAQLYYQVKKSPWGTRVSRNLLLPTQKNCRSATRSEIPMDTTRRGADAHDFPVSYLRHGSNTAQHGPDAPQFHPDQKFTTTPLPSRRRNATYGERNWPQDADLGINAEDPGYRASSECSDAPVAERSHRRSTKKAKAARMDSLAIAPALTRSTSTSGGANADPSTPQFGLYEPAFFSCEEAEMDLQSCGASLDRRIESLDFAELSTSLQQVTGSPKRPREEVVDGFGEVHAPEAKYQRCNNGFAFVGPYDYSALQGATYHVPELHAYTDNAWTYCEPLQDSPSDAPHRFVELAATRHRDFVPANHVVGPHTYTINNTQTRAEQLPPPLINASQQFDELTAPGQHNLKPSIAINWVGKEAEELHEFNDAAECLMAISWAAWGQDT